MSKLLYPVNTETTIAIDYVNSIVNAPKIKKSEIEKFLKKSGLGFSLKEFLILPFEAIVTCSAILDQKRHNKKLTFNSSYSKSLIDLKKLFNYSELLSSSISPFFMKFSSLLNIKTCCYCNIDFVNSYIPFKNDYQDFFDLINTSDLHDLCKINGIGVARAKIIKNKCCGKIKSITDLNIHLKSQPALLALLLSIKNTDDGIAYENLKDQKNHYTIDHILPQNDFPFFSLCLYNLVPACYTCNSKLKKSKLISKDYIELSKLSPTSSLYKNPLEFKLFLKENYSKNNLPTEFTQYKVQLDTNNNYPDFFNLQGRYNFHKNESLKLIKQRKIYSDSQISEMSKLLKIDIIEIKKQLFGASLFEEDTNEPFEKYKKDIARQLDII